MIVFMENANMENARTVAGEFSRRKMDVQVKNGDGKIVLAILGLAADKIDSSVVEQMPGVEKCEKKNDFFNKNYGLFDEAWRFFHLGY